MIPSPKEHSSELRCLCPFCGSATQSGRIDAKFYINNETGLYICYHCGIKGKDLPNNILEELSVIDEITKKSFDQSCLAKLQWGTSSPELMKFGSERLIAASVLEQVIGYSPEYQAIALPITAFNGEITGIKYRKIDPEAKPRYLSETGSVHEGYWLRGEDDSKVLIVEGEIDALTAQLMGFKGFIMACGTNRIPQSQLNHLRSFKNVFILPDNDLGGLELENSANELLGPFKGKIIKLKEENIKDLNELLTKGGYDVCSKFIRSETQTELERDTKSLSDSIPELLTYLSDKRNTCGISTGWNSVDALLGGGLRPNEMSVINAFAKTGKTSFLNNIIHNLAKSGKKVALASFEMDPARTIFPSLLSIASGINIRNLPLEDLADTVNLLSNEYSYLGNVITLKRFGYTPWDDIEEWATLMKKTNSIEYLFLDHAGFMVEKMTDAEENQTLAKNIKKLTNTLGLNISVVVQAPKTKDGLSLQTSYGGMAWAMNADNFFILERSKDNEMELRVRLEAARYPGANPSSTPALLFYNRDNCSLVE